MSDSPKKRSPISWIPSAYLAEGIPYSMIMIVAATMFKDFGHGDGEITAALASIGFAWTLKPLWAAFLDMFKTKKFFVLTMEIVMAGLLALIAFALPFESYFQSTLAILWILAFASATQDICIDGVYITTLNKKDQAKYVGIQGVFWNIGMLFARAGIVYIAGYFGEGEKSSWSIAFGVSAGVMALLAVYHYFALPQGSISKRPESIMEVLKTFWETVVAFASKKSIIGMLLFVALFRSSEGLLIGVGHLFLQAPLEAGGIGLTLMQKATIDGLISVVISLLGGILGGLFISKYGLKRTLFFMALCVNVPNLTYVYLSQVVSPESPVSISTVAILVTIEKFGYSFGFVSNMLYMMQQISPGKFHMTHYAFCTAIMNAVLIPTLWASGKLADAFGYQTFFLIVMFACIPSLIAAKFAPFPKSQPSESEA